MSVIVSRALPDVRDGLKPSQRRILVAMNDLNLTPGAGRVEVRQDLRRHQRQLPPARRKRHLSHAGPHGPGVEHAPRADRQAGQFRLDRRPAAGGHAVYRSPHVADRRADARRPEARHGRLHAHLRRAAAPSRRCCRRSSPTCWSTARNGIAVGMATSIPPHNLGEICDALVRADRRARRVDRRTAGNRPGPRLSHRRHHLRPQRHSPRLSTRAAARSRSAPARASRSTARTASGSSSARFPSSRPATASKSGSPSWSTKTASRAFRPSATKAT